MSSLINRIQRAMLGSAGAEKVRALLAELAIPAGGSGGSMREVRRGFLRSISDEAILRDALANIGLSGGGNGGAQALSNTRTAILHNLRDSETTLREGLNDLLSSGDLGGGGDGGQPDWVPANAKIHIDLVGGDPQGRAWVEGTGEVAVETLLGNDPVIDNGWGPSGYDNDNLTVDGYDPTSVVDEMVTAYIGAARTKLLAGATVRLVYKRTPASLQPSFLLVLMSEDGGDAVLVELPTSLRIALTSYSGSAADTTATTVLTITGVNGTACTVTDTRLEAAANGNADIAETALDEFDRPPGNPFVAAFVDFSSGLGFIQSITFYDPLPNTTGLSELSAAT